MVFSSFTFLIYFLPAFLLLYFLIPKDWRNAVIFAGSLVFYYYGVKDHPFYLILMLITIDNKTIVIPNGMLTNSSLTNATAKDERRLDLKVSISYQADLRKAKALIEEILRSDECVMKDEEINVFVDELAESAVILGARAWVKNEEFWPTRWRMLETIKLTLDEHGIEIPYPQLTVHMHE